MNTFLRTSVFLTALVIPVSVFAQQGKSMRPPAHTLASSAYAEVLLRTTEAKAELESIVADYTESSPRVIDLRFEVASLRKVADRLASVRPAESGKLTLALGRLLVQRARLDTDLAGLLRSYTSEHPEVRRTAKKLEIFDAAINEVLQ